jgi:hypothetical protein
MSGMFQRIARRHADRPDEPAESAPAPTERIEPVSPTRHADQPTIVQPAASVPPPVRTLHAPAAATAADPEQPAAPAATPAAAPEAPAAASEAATAVPEAPTAAPAPRRPGFRVRGRIRRRLRYLRKLRELQVRDLGGLVFDLRRFERKRDDLVAQKIDRIRACDDELHALELALDERRDLRDVREPGIGGTCPRCFAVFGSADRFCATCGAALGGAVQGPAQVPPAPAPPPATPPPPAGGSGPAQ